MSRLQLTAPLGRGLRAWLDLLATRCPPDRVENARACVAVGSVLELEVDAGILRGQVQGDVATPHEVEVRIRPLDEEGMAEIREPLHERMASTDALLQLLCPTSPDLRATCTCADWSPLCEHGATLFLAFLDIHPARRVELLTFRGYAPDSDEVAAALEAIHRAPPPPRPVFGLPAKPHRKPRRAPRKHDSETLPLPLDFGSTEPSPPPERQTVAPPQRQTATPPIRQTVAPPEGPTATPPQRQSVAPPLYVPPPEPAPHPLAGFWRAADLPLRLDFPAAPAASMLEVLGPPPWSDGETARAVLGPLWDAVAAHARSLVVS